jgi:hypothetical protein
VGKGDDATVQDRSPNLLEQIVQASIERLAVKADSSAARSIRHEILDCQRELDVWRTSPPTEEARRAMRLRLLAINTRVTTLP